MRGANVSKKTMGQSKKKPFILGNVDQMRWGRNETCEKLFCWEGWKHLLWNKSAGLPKKGLGALLRGGRKREMENRLSVEYGSRENASTE